MKISSRFFPSIIQAAALALCLATAIGSCGVTGPDESPWQDVAAFSWPTTTGTMMRYRVEEKTPSGGDSIYYREETIARSERQTRPRYRGQEMLMLRTESDLSTYFLPLKDTLVTKLDRTGSDFALVAPLEKGRTWISGYVRDTVPSMKAEVIERFSELKLEGNVYTNVIVVKYSSLNKKDRDYWIRFFAKDVGAILTLKHTLPGPGGIIEPEPQETQRTVLVERSVANI